MHSAAFAAKPACFAFAASSLTQYRWGVVQPVGHLTVNEDGEGSNPSAPAKLPVNRIGRSGRMFQVYGRLMIRSTVRWANERLVSGTNLPSSEYAGPRPGQTRADYWKQGPARERLPVPRSAYPADQWVCRHARASPELEHTKLRLWK
jgi:hypothetical protein